MPLSASRSVCLFNFDVDQSIPLSSTLPSSQRFRRQCSGMQSPVPCSSSFLPLGWLAARNGRAVARPFS
ncbi:hypothetical protein E0H49_33615 [Rhizobium leguminosarum bv. viciae]|nr:hypothetical protein ELH99_27545 [Rhizobium leguminosarum]TBY14345.1 hypothetical protein E0H30_35030 [Rhizobium leguminosarum bv. viciae]TBY17288.1 hypothetical protein E0H37_35455 [Rhizobium leguminosarum bv. viciae]TBY91435.1 hypothetical protein E0H49_33615 [Rhizobium leguminosarum bv. viciae]